jgi:hypothetical protein
MTREFSVACSGASGSCGCADHGGEAATTLSDLRDEIAKIREEVGELLEYYEKKEARQSSTSDGGATSTTSSQTAKYTGPTSQEAERPTREPDTITTPTEAIERTRERAGGDWSALRANADDGDEVTRHDYRGPIVSSDEHTSYNKKPEPRYEGYRRSPPDYDDGEGEDGR